MKIIRILEQEQLPSYKGIERLIPKMVQGVQQIYDEWKSEDNPNDDPYAGGGICQEFAGVFVEVLSSAGYDATEITSSVGEQHVWAVVKTAEGVFEVDIPFCVYETGGGYNWDKIPDVTFKPGDIHIGKISSNPDDFEQYLEDY